MSEGKRKRDVEQIISDFNRGNTIFITKAENKVPGVFESRTKGQDPHTLVVECADSWVGLGLVTHSPFGRIFTLTKNAANIVDHEEDSIAANATYALNHLPGINLIAVQGHYDCGGIKGLDDLGSSKLEPEVQAHLEKAKPALEIVEKMIAVGRIPSEDRHKAIVEANVLLQEQNLQNIRAVRSLVQKNAVQIRGSVYDPLSGKLHWGYPVLEKHGVVEEIRTEFRARAARKLR